MTAVEAHQKIEKAAENNSPDIRNVREIAEGKRKVLTEAQALGKYRHR